MPKDGPVQWELGRLVAAKRKHPAAKTTAATMQPQRRASTPTLANLQLVWSELQYQMPSPPPRIKAACIHTLPCS